MCRKKKNTVDQKKSEKMKKKTKNKNKSKTKQRKSQSQTRPTGPRLRGRRPNRFLSLSLSLSLVLEVLPSFFFNLYIYFFVSFKIICHQPQQVGSGLHLVESVDGSLFIFFFLSVSSVNVIHSSAYQKKKWENDLTLLNRLSLGRPQKKRKCASKKSVFFCFFFDIAGKREPDAVFLFSFFVFFAATRMLRALFIDRQWPRKQIKPKKNEKKREKRAENEEETPPPGH